MTKIVTQDAAIKLWDVLLEWDSFHPAFTWEKYPIYVRYLSFQLACLPIFK